MNFAHLHIHNEYSYLDGLGSGKDYAEYAAELGYEYLAITNHGNVDGVIKWQSACEAVGIKPIIGCEAYVVPDATIKEKGMRNGHVTLWVKNEKGWHNLLMMLNWANMEGFYYRPRVSFNLLLEHCEGLVVATACIGSFVRMKGGPELLEQLRDTLPRGDLYIETMPHCDPNNLQAKWNAECLKLSKELKLPLLATHDCHYVREEDETAQEVLLAVQKNQKWTDPQRFRFTFTELYLKTPEEILALYRKQDVLSRKQILTAMENTIEVARKCADFRIEKRDVSLPPLPGNEINEEETLHDLCIRGFERLVEQQVDEEQWARYDERYAEEFTTITSMGFTRYFLIVWELVSWCRENDIMVGPGRGSAGGCLIAYLLGITTVDPLKYGLLFKRFINPERVDLPDIDLDFEDTKRHLVRQHLMDTYGENCVAGISTFLRMKGRAAIRDVGRVFELPHKDVDAMSHAIDHRLKRGAIAQAIDETVDGRSFQRRHKQETSLALALEGQVRGAGQHAGAVVVADEDLTRSSRCVLVRRGDNLVVNWEKGDAEYMGLMKLDILGLNTLTILNETRKLVEKNYEVEIDYESMPLDDKTVFAEITAGHTVGSFQLNAWPTTKLCKQVGVETFGLISDVVALVRPGPFKSGMTEEFIRRKHGGTWEPKHEIYERITHNTHGVLVYQEQVMQVISEVAGLPYETADAIRRIIGRKRDAREFRPFERAFIRGCLEHETFTREEAEEFWEGLQAHASYSFNKSHSVEYAMMSYWTTWLRVNYAAEFLSCNLSYGAEAQKSSLIKEARRLGLEIVLPKLGVSKGTEWVASDGKLYMPFLEIKGVGEVMARQLEEQASPKNVGFFKRRNQPTADSLNLGAKAKELLTRIEEFETEREQGNLECKLIDDLFTFNVANCFIGDSDRLRQLVGNNDINLASPEVLEGELTLNLAERQRGFRTKKLLQCTRCELIKQCRQPVMPSRGTYAVMVVGEGPGKNEDRKGEGFVGDAGDLLWEELGKYGLVRSLFHVSNVIKCYPRITKSPKWEHIEACSPWIDEEIRKVKPFLILAFGNTCLKYFKGKDSGIMGMNAITEWNDKAGAWVCWCVHPAFVLRRRSNRELFEEGIENFVNKLKSLGGEKIFSAQLNPTGKLRYNESGRRKHGRRKI